MTPLAIAFFLALFGSSIALPVKPDSKLGPVVRIPILLEDFNDESSPALYTLLLSKLNEPENIIDDKLIEKREAKEEEQQDDLETAAGNYALRPLFVYRQQLAYRQRVRDAYRRRNGF
ncbi:uncharacterized protein LOC114882532 [Osmia bicornis bicornis]|uniref:uncharacterized protein LOC114882532 n=1 Tax=Osmia bicornis bicornis TaxID=1437191 RepID=UPI0010F4BB20|nr:uncharacterized protein LOC114882532 [Osmia bicornis bicornis]